MTYDVLRIAYWVLPIVYCVLRIAYCVLRIAYCVLPIAYSVNTPIAEITARRASFFGSVRNCVFVYSSLRLFVSSSIRLLAPFGTVSSYRPSDNLFES
jgi:hypothetical protein